MGIYSSVDLSRADALRLIRSGLDTASNEELASVLFDMFADHTLNNYGVGEWAKNDRDERGVIEIERVIEERGGMVEYE